MQNIVAVVAADGSFGGLPLTPVNRAAFDAAAIQ